MFGAENPQGSLPPPRAERERENFWSAGNLSARRFILSPRGVWAARREIVRNQQGIAIMKKQIFGSWILGLALAGWASGSAQAASDNGRAGVMPAYYDHELFSMNFMELP